MGAQRALTPISRNDGNHSKADVRLAFPERLHVAPSGWSGFRRPARESGGPKAKRDVRFQPKEANQDRPRPFLHQLIVK